ncbi:pantetheine-phosphate adenylyltransferase [Nemorincola caseinilytica]|uniref:Phosphopantetheine adenylyltransferase n=2 Tax=Nemorincola caseinilytica TaxID=2054315 RepID=A0ABP8NQN6_9BACT
MNDMERICLFPGTFDPITLGHIDVVERAVSMFDKLIIGVGINSTKQPMFSVEQRVGWIGEIFSHDKRIEVMGYEGLTVDICHKLKAQYILRGIRYIADFEYEKAIADMNRMLAPDVETVFLTCSPAYSTISSTLVRDVIRNGGNARLFLPPQVRY